MNFFKKGVSCCALLLAFSMGPCRAEAYEAEADLAVGWIKSTQKPDGSWGASAETAMLDTTAAVTALWSMTQKPAEYYRGITWIENHGAANLDYKARRIRALSDHGDSLRHEVNHLVASQNPGASTGDSGWGLSAFYGIDPLDTILALQALRTTGWSDAAPVLSYLKNSQKSDGGWSLWENSQSDAVTTALVAQALQDHVAADPGLDAVINNALAKLTSEVTPSSPLLLRANAALALLKRDKQDQHAKTLLDSLLAEQEQNGSWANDMYTTATVLKATSLFLGMDPREMEMLTVVRDAKLRAAINAALGKNAADAFSKGEMRNLRHLVAAGLGISNLTGLEDAVNLESVDLSNNNIASLGPLANLPIIDIDVQGNPLNGSEDTDGDGMPDAWETAYGFNPIQDDAQADLDSDGFTNGEEYLNETDPTNRADYGLALNIYGSGTQIRYLQAKAGDFLTGVLGCAYAESATDSGRRNGVTKGVGCSAPEKGIVIRYSAGLSYDGISAVRCEDSLAVSSCPDKCQREMASLTGATWGSQATPGAIAQTECVDVTLGASLAQGESFTQGSTGNEHGHLGGAFIDSRFLLEISVAGLDVHEPYVIPQAFLVNQTALPGLANLSRPQIANIFRGGVSSWDTLLPGLPAKKTVVCMRHAGSGAGAILDKTLLWRAANMAIIQLDLPSDFQFPTIWFNATEEDMLRCVDENGGFPTDTHAAIGFAAADSLEAARLQDPAAFPNAGTIMYNKFFPTKETVAYGAGNFWAWQRLYENPAAALYAATNPLVLQLMQYVSDPANMPDPQGHYWAAEGEMRVVRENDLVMPHL